MKKKEYYKHILPHFQHPGQAYFVTWILKDAIPPKALKRYTGKLELLKLQIDFLKGAELGAANSDSPILKNADRNPRHPANHPEQQKLRLEYNLLRKKYIKAYDDLLAVQE